MTEEEEFKKLRKEEAVYERKMDILESEMAFERTMKEVHQTACANGFWDKPVEPGTSIALMHRELSEALEAFRHGNPPDKHVPDFDNATVELADCVIWIMDFAERNNMRLAEAITAKAEFNKTRERKHGKEF